MLNRRDPFSVFAPPEGQLPRADPSGLEFREGTALTLSKAPFGTTTYQRINTKRIDKVPFVVNGIHQPIFIKIELLPNLGDLFILR